MCCGLEGFRPLSCNPVGGCHTRNERVWLTCWARRASGCSGLRGVWHLGHVDSYHLFMAHFIELCVGVHHVTNPLAFSTWHVLFHPIHPSPGSVFWCHQLNAVESICFLLLQMLKIAFFLYSILFGSEYLLATELRQAWVVILSPFLACYLVAWQLLNLSLGFIYENEK